MAGNSPPSFRLQYGALQARFEKAGGTLAITAAHPPKEVLETVLREVKAIRDHFGTEVKEVGNGEENLRRIQTIALSRLIAWWISDKEIGRDQLAATQWDELHSLLEKWRQAKSDDRKQWPDELLRCEEWFWDRVQGAAPSIPFWNSDITLGSQHYKEKDAKKARDNARQELSSRNTTK